MKQTHLNFTAYVMAAVAIAEATAKISNADKQRRFQTAIATLSETQQNALGEKLMAAETQQEREQIMTDSLVDVINAQEANKARKETVMYIVAGSLAAIILVAAIVYAVKIKKKS